MQRKGVLVSVWVLATATATLIAWAAVSQVTRQVAPQAVMPLPRTAAIADLSPAPQPDAAVAQREERNANRTRRVDAAAADTDRAPQQSAGSEQDDAGAGPSAPEPADETDTQDTTGPAPARQRDEPEGESQAEQEEQSAATTVTEAYDLVGGIVTVRYSGTSATLVEASPESGFVTEVNDGGPGKVDVRFRSDDHESRLVTRMRDGEPDPQREERPR